MFETAILSVVRVVATDEPVVEAVVEFGITLDVKLDIKLEKTIKLVDTIEPV